MTTGLLTTILGRNAIIADLGGGADLALTHVAWGDANGVPYAPNEAQTALVNEKYRSTIASVAVVAGAIVVDAIIPADTPDGSGRPSHGFNVAEVGLFSSTGTLIGLARCGNGYKPPPSSGQAAAATYRLKLAVANPSAISVVIDPQAQIALGRHVRAPWLTVDGVLNAPPASPNQGDTYIIGPAPTGAWAGFANRIAQWIGVWSLAVAPIGHHVVDNSKSIDSGARWLERTAAGWAPGVSRLIQKQPGNFAVAGGTANALTLALDPMLTAQIAGMPIRILPGLTNTGPATLYINNLGALAILGPGGTALRAGDLPAGVTREVMYHTALNAFVLTSPIARPPSNFQVYDVPGTYTFVVPAGVYWLFVEEAIGGGGGGGAAATSAGQFAGASGGGGGGYVSGGMPVSPGQSITIVVGAGGAGGIVVGTTPFNGSPGTSTTVGGLFTATAGTYGVSVYNSFAALGGNGGMGFGGPSRNGIGGSPPTAYNGLVLGGPGGGAYGGSISFFGGIGAGGPGGIGAGGGGSGAASANGSGGSGGDGQPGRVKLSW